MIFIKLITLISFLIVYGKCTNPGLQVRLTESGMKYAIDVAMKIFREDLAKKVINKSGRKGSVSYRLTGIRMSNIRFSNYQLFPVTGTGLRLRILDISLEARGSLWYQFKKGWFKISDTTGVRVKAKRINADLILTFGENSGQPTIDLSSCSDGVNYIDLDFNGGASWLYNLFSGYLANKLKREFEDTICKVARENVNRKTKSQLATFPVVKKFDSFAYIDYSLTTRPQFTSRYMDIFLKGKLYPTFNAVSNLVAPPMNAPTPVYSQMVYFWLSDYTINTAGEVVQNLGFLKKSFKAWDQDMSTSFKRILNTKNFGLIFFKLFEKYPNAPMGFDVYSYKAPTINIQRDKLNMNIFARGTFKVQDSNKKIIDLFTLTFDLIATLKVGNKHYNGEHNINGEITSFDYKSKIEVDYFPDLDMKLIPIDSPIIKELLNLAIIEYVNPVLQKGFPLPNLGDVTLYNFKINLLKNAIQVGSDVKYTRS